MFGTRFEKSLTGVRSMKIEIEKEQRFQDIST
jgi:hypothetical protein